MTHSFPTRRSSDLGETHTSDVYAVRDSVLLRLPAPTVLEAFQQFPAALLRLTRLIARRLRQNAALKPHVAVHRRNSLAVVAATPSAPARRVAERLQDRQSVVEGQSVTIRGDHGGRRLLKQKKK